MKTFITIPTYNEKENITRLINEILNLKIKNLHILVIDDNSPDKTWQIVEKISKKYKNIHLLLRKTKRGRGYAGRAGFIYALDHGADIIIEMDADFSHDPKVIPMMLKEIENADLILGSRAMKGSRELGRSKLRRLITYYANLYIRIMLGIKVKDCNSGYRCFRRKVLLSIDPKTIESKGPAIIQEILFKAHLKSFRIKEIPITFINRTKGKSKLGLKELAIGYWMILKLKVMHIWGRI